MKTFERVIYVGVDLGKMTNPTAIIFLERVIKFKTDLEDKKETNVITHIERFPLKTPYHDIVDKVAIMFENPQLKREGQLIIDATGVGEPVREMFVKKKLFPIGIWICGGHTVTDRGNSCWNVPRTDLLSSFTIMVDSQNLKVSPGLELRQQLLEEMKGLRDREVKIEKEEDVVWREEGHHDDIALAAAIACWWSIRSFPRIPEAYEHENPSEEDENIIKDYDPYGR